MSYSYTESHTTTFTVTHARHIAAKVAADLKGMQRFYGLPSDQDIADYQEELIALLKAGYLRTVSYGFRRNGAWIEPTLRYATSDLAGATVSDDDPGKLRPGADVSNALFYSYLTYSPIWDGLGDLEKDEFKLTLPFQRQGALEPLISGYLLRDKTYAAGGRALDRSSVRS